MVCENPVEIECREVETRTLVAVDTPSVVQFDHQCNLDAGLVCYHGNQTDDLKCLDYEVRYKCPVTGDLYLLKLVRINIFLVCLWNL